jgi:hypothetical protein
VYSTSPRSCHWHMALLSTSSYEVLSIDNCKLDRLDADQNSVDSELVIPFGDNIPNLAIKHHRHWAMSAMSLAARVTVVATPMTALAVVPTCGVVELNRIVRRKSAEGGE